MQAIEKEFEDKILLITGGAGCIGSNLVKKLIDFKVDKIILVDDLSSSYEWNISKDPSINLIKGDILNEEVLKRAFNYKPNIVYHLAAQFANQHSVEHPARDLMVNGMGTLKLLELANSSDIERVVYTSSGCGVYGLSSKIPFEENDVTISLHTPYQITKLLGELYMNYFFNMYNLPIVNARLFNVYGPGEVPGKYRNVIPNFFYWAINGIPLPITGDGSETRDWTYVDDVIDALLAMGINEKAVGEAINIGTGQEYQVIDMANMINEITGNNAGIKYLPRRNWDVKNRLLASIDKARNILGFEPKTHLKKGLEKVYEWFLQNLEKIKKNTVF